MGITDLKLMQQYYGSLVTLRGGYAREGNKNLNVVDCGEKIMRRLGELDISQDAALLSSVD
jgi:hypothetical protein